MMGIRLKYTKRSSKPGLEFTQFDICFLTPTPWQSQYCQQTPAIQTLKINNKAKIKERSKIEIGKIMHTVFHPSGSKQEVILVLMPGNGPGSRVTLPPQSFITSAVL